jgi:hypothetical protein
MVNRLQVNRCDAVRLREWLDKVFAGSAWEKKIW